MTVRVNKPSFNIREKLSELGRKFGLKGSELAAAETVQEARDVVSAGRKNMIINGGMNVFQRNNGGLITSSYSSTEYQVDRFGGQIQQGSVFTAERADNDAPPGFRYSLKYTTTNAVSPNANHYFWVGQRIEGYNFQQCGWNTSTPKHITISFWVKSSVTGTWALAIKTGTSAGTAYLATYDIHVANTWEYKTITVPPPFTLTDLQYTTSAAISFQFDLGTSRSGDLYASARNKWLNENLYTDADCVKIHGIAGATWQLTGFQVEVGKNATEFEHRPYGEELALCQRYYQKIYFTTSDYPFGFCYTYNPGNTACAIPLAAPMRTSISAINFSTLRIRGYNQNGVNNSQNVTNITGQTQEGHALLQADLSHSNVGSSDLGAASVLTNGVSNSSSYLEIEAEL